VLQALMEEGTVKPVIDKTYELSSAPEALAYFGEGHARAKVVITA
jgi:NADPH:quinone reductase-like Zn-dependent oxidoreductase